MADPMKIKEIQSAVSIPVMAKVRIGHFVEAQVHDMDSSSYDQLGPRGAQGRFH